MWPMLARGSHSFTCHPHANHTYLYCPAAEHHRLWLVLNVPTHGEMARLSWLGWLVIY